MEFFVGAVVIFILFLLLIIFLIPSPDKNKQKRAKKEAQSKEPEKDWPVIVGKLEKQASSLRLEITSLEKKLKDTEKHLAVEGAKVKALQEKISQERQWLQKEEGLLDKQGKEVQQTKSDLLKAQEHLEKEHAIALRLDRELKDLKIEYDTLNNQRRAAEADNSQLKATVERSLNEIREIKKENAELKKKKEDTVWVAKSEYDALEEEWKQVKIELDRIKNQK